MFIQSDIQKHACSSIHYFHCQEPYAGNCHKKKQKSQELLQKRYYHIGKTYGYQQKMVKIHGIEDHLLDKIKEYNGIGCFVEEFIEQMLQYGKVNKKNSKYERQNKTIN